MRKGTYEKKVVYYVLFFFYMSHLIPWTDFYTEQER